MIVLGIGTNFGNRIRLLRRAVQKLNSPIYSPSIQVLACSPIYESDALLPADAPSSWDRPFLNLNLLCQTDLAPLKLLKHVKNLEKTLGRQDRGRWAPREIDIDILVMGPEKIELPGLTIPHPHLMQRPFAMLPLADLLPHWRHPDRSLNSNAPISELVSAWRNQSTEKVPFRTRRSTEVLTELMGILNLTPDSFSDGGLHSTVPHALSQAKKLIHSGASVLDLGAESTRPGATPVGPEEEWARLEPVLKPLRIDFQNRNPSPLLSIDTRHPEVAQKCIQAGADWINDVTGFSDPKMMEAVCNSGNSEVELVMMHSKSVPPTRQDFLPDSFDCITQMLDWAQDRIRTLETWGIHRDRILFDPGLGFGKSPQQTWQLIRNLEQLRKLDVRLLIGHSRKSFFTSLTESLAHDRDPETIALSIELARKGVDYLRVHQVDWNSRALKVWSQCDGVIPYSNPTHLL